MSHQGLRPPIAMFNEDLRLFSSWCQEQLVEPGDDTVTTSAIKDKAVTYAKIQDVTADRILGRLSTLGIVTELTATQLVTLLQSEGWSFSGNLGFFGTTAITQPANITDANVAHALNPVFSDTEVEAALDALGVKFNDLKDNVIEALGLSA